MGGMLICRETWSYECQRCQREWEVPYEVWHVDDCHGTDVMSYRKNGLCCMPPWSGVSCPHCGGLKVKPLPVAHRPPLARPSADPRTSWSALPQEPTLIHLARLHSY